MQVVYTSLKMVYLCRSISDEMEFIMIKKKRISMLAAIAIYIGLNVSRYIELMYKT